MKDKYDKIALQIGILQKKDVKKYSKFILDTFNNGKYYQTAFSKEEWLRELSYRTVKEINKKLKAKNRFYIVSENEEGDILATIEADLKFENDTPYTVIRSVIVSEKLDSEHMLVRTQIVPLLTEELIKKSKACGVKLLFTEIKNNNADAIKISQFLNFVRLNKKHEDPGRSWYMKVLD